MADKRGQRPYLDEQPSIWHRGDPILARRLNEPVHAIRRISRGIARPKQIPTEEEEKRTRSAQFEVVEVRGDYLVCVKKDGASYVDTREAARYHVAKPYLLRRTPFDGATRDGITYAYTSDIERTATDADEHTETQEIVPSYVAGDVIYAAQNIEGGTGVTSGVDPSPVKWLDLNADGRAWAAA